MKNNKIILKIIFIFVLFLFIYSFNKVNISSKEINIHELLQNAEWTQYDEQASITFFTPGANSRSDYFGYAEDIIEGSFVDVFKNNDFITYRLIYMQDINSFTFEKNKKYAIAFDNADVAYNGHDIYNNSSNNRLSGSYKALESLTEQVILKYMKDIYGSDLLNYKIPRINMVGHSRGGIINMLFSINHPLLVDKLFSMGTPYNGSSLYYDLLDQGFDIMPVFDNLILTQCVDKNISQRLKQEWNSYKANDDYHYHTKLYTLSGLTSYGNLNETLSNLISTFELKFLQNFFVRALFDLLTRKQTEIINTDGTYSILYRFNQIINYLTDLKNEFEKYVGTIYIGGFKADDILLFINYVLSILNHMKKTENGTYYTESDFFVDDLSQSADGFTVDYNYKKIFTNANSNFAFHRYDSTPAIVHAQEPLDSDFINYVLINIG